MIKIIILLDLAVQSMKPNLAVQSLKPNVEIGSQAEPSASLDGWMDKLVAGATLHSTPSSSPTQTIAVTLV